MRLLLDQNLSHRLLDLLACRASELEVDSPTGAMRALYARHETDMAAARQALATQPGQVGAVIYMGTRWVGLDLPAGLWLSRYRGA